MAPRYPRGLWLPIPQNATAAKITPTQLILHTAVSGASSLRGWFTSGAGGANTSAHGYIRQDGTFEQYLDFDVKSAAQWAGNLHGIAIETWDGGQPATTPWNQAQLDRIIDFGKWLHDVFGIPAVLCPSDQQPGIGWHSLFPSWNQSKHTCVGPARIPQVPGIIAAIGAQPAPHPDPAPVPVPPKPHEEVHMFMYENEDGQFLVRESGPPIHIEDPGDVKSLSAVIGHDPVGLTKGTAAKFQ